MSTVSQLHGIGVGTLHSAIGDDAPKEAFLLLAFAANRQVASLRLNLDDEIDAEAEKTYLMAIAQRAKFKPIAQIIGKRAFWKHDFIVTPDVLDPRPDTETLIEQAIKLQGVRSILDLGTGSGCILLSLLSEFPQAIGQGVDASLDAINVATRNGEALGLSKRATFALGDWCDGISQTFDLVVSNPPYISADAMHGLSRDVLDWEPRMALTPEGDGLRAYREIIKAVPDVMNTGAVLILEIGFDQGSAVCDLLNRGGFDDVQVIQDINHKDRIVQARMG